MNSLPPWRWRRFGKAATPINRWAAVANSLFAGLENTYLDLLRWVLGFRAACKEEQMRRTIDVTLDMRRVSKQLSAELTAEDKPLSVLNTFPQRIVGEFGTLRRRCFGILAAAAIG